MKLRAHNAKRDANEKEIVGILERLGFSVFRLDKPLDLLLGRGGKNYLAEVKDGSKAPSAGKNRRTEDQKTFMRDWRGQHVVLSSVEETVEWVNSLREAGL